MPILREYRFPLPMTVEEYKIGQLYAVMHASKHETQKQTAVEILQNVPFENEEMGHGQYTHKIYHIGSRLPRIVQAIAPASAQMVHEHAWNAYPYCKTVISNPFLGDRFEIVIESMHLADDGSTENALKLDAKRLKMRKVQLMDIGKERLEDPIQNQLYDPTTTASTKTGRGPLVGNWMEKCKPMMCAYKLVSIKFEVFGVQSRTESFIDAAETNIYLKFHKQLFTLLDEWIDLSMVDIRRMEDELKQELDKTLDQLNLETRPQKEGSVASGAIEFTPGKREAGSPSAIDEDEEEDGGEMYDGSEEDEISSQSTNVEK